MSLAEGEITQYQLNAEQRMLLSEPGNKSNATYKRRALQSVRLSSVSSSGRKKSIIYCQALSLNVGIGC
jgi:hypothetical protein